MQMANRFMRASPKFEMTRAGQLISRLTRSMWSGASPNYSNNKYIQNQASNASSSEPLFCLLRGGVLFSVIIIA